MEAAPAGQPSPPAHHPRFFLALGLGIGWLLLLAAFAFWSANPVTLNRVQLLHSDAIVAGIVSQDRQSLQIESVLYPSGSPLKPGENLTLLIPPQHWQSGEARIVPLMLTAEGKWQLTPPPFRQDAQLDYPDRPDLREDLNAILASRSTAAF